MRAMLNMLMDGDDDVMTPAPGSDDMNDDMKEMPDGEAADDDEEEDADDM